MSSILSELVKDSSPNMDMGPVREPLSSHKIEMPLVSDVSPAKPTLMGPDYFSKFMAEELDIDEEIKNYTFDDFPDAKLMEDLEAVAEKTMRSIEQEQLQPADAIARVPVPIMDFSIPEPDWTRLRNSASSIFKWIQAGHEDIFNLPRWPRDRLTESKLVWRPVGFGASPVCITDCVETSEILIQSFIRGQDEKDMPTSSDFVQRRDRLAFLDADDTDDDIEPLLTKAKFRTNLVEMVKKRGLDTIVDPTVTKRCRSADQPPERLLDGGSLTQMAHTGEHRKNERRDGQSQLLKGSTELSARLLDRFTSGRTRKQWAVSKFFPSKETERNRVLALPSPPESSERNCIPDNQNPIEPEAMAPSKPVARAPLPPIDPPFAPLTVFISLDIPRFLIQALERLIPNLTLLERDYRAYNEAVWSPGSICRAEVVPPLAYDADITVSPTTGLVVTSMIFVRQKPRPGMSQNGLQERIEKVSPRYERVVVLVGGGGGEDDTLREVSALDSAALTELQGFACGLESKVVVHYIGGGDNTLSRWAASMVCRYAPVDHSQLQKGLLDAETLWELFLRRAGFNVYAAQAIAGQLKVPNAEEADTGPSQYGLAAFVTMTRAERKQRFGPLVGLRVLDRVSHLVDEIWNNG